jgi:uncharacterized protein YfiM (DUF2279 family)
MRFLMAILFIQLFLTVQAFAFLTPAGPVVAVTGTYPIVSSGGTSPVISLGSEAATPFYRLCTITSAAAATPVNCLAEADVVSGKKVHITGFLARVNGATAWATTATCALQDTAASPIAQATFAVAGMTGNSTQTISERTNITLAAGVLVGTGATASKGIDLACDANGTGSNFVVQVWGYMN